MSPTLAPSKFIGTIFKKLSTDVQLTPPEVATYLKIVSGEIPTVTPEEEMSVLLNIKEIHVYLLNEIMTEQAFTKRAGYAPSLHLRDSLTSLIKRPLKGVYTANTIISYLLLQQDRPRDYKGIYDVFPLNFLAQTGNLESFEVTFLEIVATTMEARREIRNLRLKPNKSASQKIRRYKQYQLQKLEQLKQEVYSIRSKVKP